MLHYASARRDVRATTFSTHVYELQHFIGGDMNRFRGPKVFTLAEILVGTVSCPLIRPYVLVPAGDSTGSRACGTSCPRSLREITGRRWT